MFLKKFIIKNFTTKDEIKNINSSIKSLEKRIKSLSEENESLKRILRFHVHGEICGFSQSNVDTWMLECHEKAKTYVYKKGEEYVFNNLFLINPRFTQGDKANIVYASSNGGRSKYVLDLSNETFIEISAG